MPCNSFPWEEDTLPNKKMTPKSHDSLASIRMFLVDGNSLQNFSAKVHVIENSYRPLNTEQKDYCCLFSADLIYSKYKSHEKFTRYLHAYLSLSALEDNSSYTIKFYKSLLHNDQSYNFIKKISESLIEIINNEFDKEIFNENLLAQCLSLLIEIAINHNELKKSKKTDTLPLENIIEYISSNIIAMCNINNIEIRIAAVILLRIISSNNNYNLQKILARFGQTLLEHVFSKYFSSPETKAVAFVFLRENFDIFLASSPYVAEMTNSVMQTQMLKYDKIFIEFLEQYLTENELSLEILKSFSIHLSFLLRKSCEINKPELINSIINLVYKNLEIIQTISEIHFVECFENSLDILSKNHSKNIRETINKITKYYLENTKKTKKQSVQKNLIDLTSKRTKKQNNNNKINNHFNEIYLLAK